MKKEKVQEPETVEAEKMTRGLPWKKLSACLMISPVHWRMKKLHWRIPFRRIKREWIY